MVKAAHKISLGDYLVIAKPWSYFFRSLLGHRYVIVARHEQPNNALWVYHSCRPQGVAFAPTDDRRHDGAQLRAEYARELPASGTGFSRTWSPSSSSAFLSAVLPS